MIKKITALTFLMLSSWAFSEEKADSGKKTEVQTEAKNQQDSPTPLAQPPALGDVTAQSDRSHLQKREKKPRRVHSTDCLVDELVIEDIKKNKEDNEQRRKQMDIEKLELEAKEKALNERKLELDELQKKIEKLKASLNEENKKKVDQLIEAFLSMSPKAAANVLAVLEDRLAVEILSKLDTEKLAKILNTLSPARSARLSEMMAGGFSKFKKTHKESEGNATRN